MNLLTTHSQRRSQTWAFAWASAYLTLPLGMFFITQNTMHFLIEVTKHQAKKHNEVLSRDNSTFSTWCGRRDCYWGFSTIAS